MFAVMRGLRAKQCSSYSGVEFRINQFKKRTGPNVNYNDLNNMHF